MEGSAPEPVEYDTVVVRFGPEIGVKSKPVRLRYERLVARYVKKALRIHGVPFEAVKYVLGRLYVTTPEAREAAEVISHVFGVSSASPAVSTTSELEDIISVGLELARRSLSHGTKFAVRCRRVGEHPYTSLDVCRLLGERILTELGHLGLRVDLEEPDKVIYVEVRERDTYLFTEIYDGVGGYPPGVQGRVVGLLSGGIDSPVACWLAMRRGCLLVPVHFDIRPFTDDRLLKKALELARILADWALGTMRYMYIVPFGHALAEIKERCPEELTCVLCKRFMLRVAERLAERERADGIITGDAVGEQASQTLKNLRAIDGALRSVPVHRPLFCFDKDETVKLAMRIGTYEVSARPDAGCSAAPSRPTTAARLEDVLEAEAALDVEALVRKALSNTKKASIEGWSR
ncbi:tRNA 4-thiouridine(8) synthase ThiI [Candidatus Bathyarchaeota archaeon]|nr:MAG: tRNA 4-thiouridine(8) synthase ThiI [Candidatus Bathyarchaeota archaeon]